MRESKNDFAQMENWAEIIEQTRSGRHTIRYILNFNKRQSDQPIFGCIQFICYIAAAHSFWSLIHNFRRVERRRQQCWRRAPVAVADENIRFEF